jgi:chromosome segregation ATPase
MNVEKTIEFILGQEARIDARLEKALERMDRADRRMDRADRRADRADKRLDRLERVVAQTNRVVTRLVRYGVSLRSDVRRHDKAILRIEAAIETLAESQQRTDSRINALAKLVDRTIRRNGKF